VLYKNGLCPEEQLADLVHDVGESSLISRRPIRDEMLKLMSSPDPLVRQNALGALAYHGIAFDSKDEFGKQLLSGMDLMLHLDEEPDCRRQAAATFGSLFRNTGDQGVINALGRVCSNLKEEHDVRAFAYTSLLTVASVPLRAQPNPIGLKLGPAEMMRVSDLVD
jgi:hypothetical protein